MDALARAAGISVAQAARENLYGIRPEAVHLSLAGLSPADWLPAEPRRSINVRHTVGLSDPLTVGEIPPVERVRDGFPQALEEYLQQTGVRHFRLRRGFPRSGRCQSSRDHVSELLHALGVGFEIGNLIRNRLQSRPDRARVRRGKSRSAPMRDG